MTSTGTQPPAGWHVAPDRLAAYARGAVGALERAHAVGAVERGSIEHHLLACEWCRGGLTAATAADDAGAGGGGGGRWPAIADRIDRVGWRRAPWVVRVSCGSPMLAAALVAVIGGLLSAVLFAASVRSRAAIGVVLAFAPVAPVAMAVAAFRPQLDPAGALATATPSAGGRLVLVRALLGSAAALLVGMVLSACTPIPLGVLVAWLLPGLALLALVLAAATFVEPTRAGLTAAVVWLVVVAWWWNGTRRLPLGAALEQFAMRAAPAQAVCTVVALAAGAVVLLRRDARPDWRAA